VALVTVTSGQSSAAERPDLAAAVRSGTVADQFGVQHSCSISYQGKQLDLGCDLQTVTTAPWSAALAVNDTPQGYGPADLAQAYGLPANVSGPQNTVTIVGVGAYPNLESDLAKYRSSYGLPACTTTNGCLSITDYHGGAPLQPSEPQIEETYAEETALDVDMASASCPSCKISMVQIPFDIGKLLEASLFGDSVPLADDFGTAVNQAVGKGTSSVSMSYGLPSGSHGAELATGAAAQALDHPGVAIVASSGDKGFTGNTQLWPSLVPTVTAAGGITLTKSGSGYAQTAWGAVHKGTFDGPGSGCSNDSGPAVGQPDSVAAYCGGHRAVADVSADADPATGVSVYDTWNPDGNGPSGWVVVGGTSAASPYIAGLYARAGNLSGVHGPNTLYAATGGIHDVTTGSNSQSGNCGSLPQATCVAGPGWDGPTGVGTPQGLSAF
jgi:subtilase family serine protease